MRVEHELTGDETALIRMEGLQGDLEILHVTDSHMAVGDERDPDAAEHVESFSARFAERTPGNVSTQQLFDVAMAGGWDAGVDATVLTGDIIHFPTYHGIEVIQQGLDSQPGVTLYTLGNHDWHFPHLPWNGDTRAEHYPRFHGLTGGTPQGQAIEVGGVRLITLDNSTYQVTDEQLAFLRAELERGQPTLLFVHIPFAIDSLHPPVMEKWKAPIMMGAVEGWTEETRERWRVPGNDAATTECCEMVASGEHENLAGIFCGHVHFPHADEFAPGRLQYVGAPGFDGAVRRIQLRLLE